MKKLTAILAVLVICFTFVSPACQVYAAKNPSYNIMDLIRLKKYIISDSGYNADFDYNSDNRVNAMDLITLKRMILGVYQPPVEPDDNPKFDEDGYYNEVVKPQF